MSASLGRSCQLIYFGKVPSRGDFVRSNAGSALIHSIDQWMSKTIELLAEDPGWKAAYDKAPPVLFAILGPQSHAGLAGHLSMSHDASGRRFPFVLAGSFEVPTPTEYLYYCAQSLSPLWRRLDSVSEAASVAQDFYEIKDRLAAQALDLEMNPTALHAPYLRYAQAQTIHSFETAVSRPGAVISLRQTLLGLGMLLQPVLAQGHSGLNKALMIPLARDILQLPHTLTFWIDLIARFFRRTSAEMAILITLHGGYPVMVMGFHGASAATLRTAMSPETYAGDLVALTDAQWVEEWVSREYGLKKLSDHLRDPSLSLATVADMFREAFLGE